MKHRRMLVATLAFAAPVVFGSCAFMSVGFICDEMGHCVPAIKVHGVICPDGHTPAPTPADCPGAPNFTVQDMGGLDLIFSAPNGVTYTTTTGGVTVSIGGGPTLNTTWIVQNNQKIVFSNPTSVGNWILSNSSANDSVDFDFNNIAITAPGNAANQTVQINTKARLNGATLQSINRTYVYYPPPPQAILHLEHLGGCNWLVTSFADHPAYTFVIERRPFLGGNWSQTYSGIDTCVGRSGEWTYRAVYKDPFGNRGTYSPVQSTYCDPDPPQ